MDQQKYPPDYAPPASNSYYASQPAPPSVYYTSESQGQVIIPPAGYNSSGSYYSPGYPNYPSPAAAPPPYTPPHHQPTSSQPINATTLTQDATQPTQQHHNTGAENVEANFGHTFSDKNIRRAFIRKVYTILFIQLVITFGLVALFVFCDPVKDYVQHNEWIYWTSYAVFFVTYFIMFCVRRKYPANLIFLTIFTLALAYMTGTISSFYDITSVFIGIGICAGVCFGITILCIFTKFDLTSCNGLILVLFMTTFWFGFACIFTYNDVLYTVYAWLVAILLMLILAVDTKLIIGGGRHQLSPEEYIFGAMSLYTDIIFIFLIFLGISGRSS